MSRSGYEDWDDRNGDPNWAAICYAGALRKTVNGKGGQAFLCEMLTALDAMPDKRLINHALQAPSFIPPEFTEGQHCAIGAVGARRGVNMSIIDPDQYALVAKTFGISETLAREIAFQNDEAGGYSENADRRWQRMREWAARRINAGKTLTNNKES